MDKKHILNTPTIIGRQVDALGAEGLSFDVIDVKRAGRSDMPVNHKHRRTKGTYREGGPWFLRYQVMTRQSNDVNIHWLGRFTYRGEFLPYNPYPEPDYNWLYNSGAPQYFLQGLFGFGAGALSDMNPTKPAFSAASSIYELREMPGMLKDLTKGVVEACQDYLQKRFSDRRRNLSSHSKTAQWHLALQFGWLPVLSDIRNFLKARKDQDKIFRQLCRDAERPVRRRRSIRNNETTEREVTINHGNPYNPYLQPALNVYAYADEGSASTKISMKSYDKIWAVAQWRYYLPPGPRDAVWERNLRRRIMGGRITPSAIYAVIPWSWLIDYFTDIGNFIDATDSGMADFLTYDYCYIMQTFETVSHVVATQYVRGLLGPEEVTGVYEYRQGYKARSPGSVFGFRLQADLSARQLGILGALGFSKLP